MTYLLSAFLFIAGFFISRLGRGKGADGIIYSVFGIIAIIASIVMLIVAVTISCKS